MRLLPIVALLLVGACKKDKDEPTDDRTRLTILHTNDWQSHMLGRGPNAEYTPELDGDDSTLGGLARVATLVDQIRGSTTHPVLLYDAGDWMSGALFQTLATSHAAELSVMDALGFDATTIGNHEFDWGAETLGEMIGRADAQGVTLPIVASNLAPNPTDPSDDALEAHFDSGRIEFTHMDTLDNGITVGLFGLLGTGAKLITPGLGEVQFLQPTETAIEAVAELSEADIVIAISHSGVDEDETLFDEVEGVDVVVGGHSHTAMFDFETTENGTVIVQAGAYTLYLGQLDLVLDGDEWVVEGYQLHEIDDRLRGDPAITEMVTDYVEAIDSDVLAPLGFEFHEAIASIPDDLPRDGCQELGLSHLVTDAYREQLTALDPGNPITIAAEAQGVIRDPLNAGSTHLQAISDFFRVLPLGGGNDDVPGYALTSFYLTGSEIHNACEVTASVAPEFSCSFFIEVSGVKCHADMDAQLYNRVQRVEYFDGAQWLDLDTDEANETLYHVAANTYVAGLMDLLGSITLGTLRVSPKDANGVEVEDIDLLLVDADPATDGVQEYKAWQAVVDYAGSFSDTDGDGVPDVPSEYTDFDPRLVGYEMKGDGHL